MPWKLVSSANVYIFEWLVGYSALLGPIAGIMIIDYWLLRRTQLHIVELYNVDSKLYPKFRLSAIIALVLGIAPNVPGFIRNGG